MTFEIGQRLCLVDTTNRSLGIVTVEEIQEDLLLGQFQKNVAFAEVESIFLGFEQAANAQALSVLPQYEAAVAALGLSLRSLDGMSQEVHDVQVWSDGGFSCRASVPEPLQQTALLSMDFPTSSLPPKVTSHA